MVSPTDPHHPMTTWDVYREHYRQATGSESSLITRVFHGAVFIVEVCAFPIAMAEATIRNHLNHPPPSTLTSRDIADQSNANNSLPRYIDGLPEVNFLEPVLTGHSMLLIEIAWFAKKFEDNVKLRGVDEGSYFIYELSKRSKVVLGLSLSEIKALNAQYVESVTRILQGSIQALKEHSHINGSSVLEYIMNQLTNRKAFADALTERFPVSLHENAEFLLNYFGENGYSEEKLLVFSRLNPNTLKLLISSLKKMDLFFVVNYLIESLNCGEDSEEKIRIFTREIIGDQLDHRSDFERMCLAAKALYNMKKWVLEPLLAPYSPVSGMLIHSSPGLSAATGDQSVYQAKFIETYDRAAEMMKRQTFAECLEFIARSRHQMAEPPPLFEGNLFGVRRPAEEAGWHTGIGNAYEKYRNWFFNRDKSQWKQYVLPDSLNYQMIVKSRITGRPLELTRIGIGYFHREKPLFGKPLAMWFHTKTINIETALAEAELSFKKALGLRLPQDEQGLETIVQAVGELHWWLAQACPFKRGSAAIAKMMASALLKYHGIEPGGFGDIEPDCMALIQYPSEFIASYSSLMRAPPPKWISAKE